MNMQACAYRTALTVAALALFGGCNGNSLSNSGALPQTLNAGPGAVAPARSREPKQKVEMRIKVPRAPKHARGRGLKPYFVASATAGVKIVVFAHGSTTPLTTTAAGLTNCNAVPGGKSCQVSASAPVGDDDFVITTYNAAPNANGTFPGMAAQLAIGKTTFTVVKGQANAIGVTLGGVVASGAVTLTSSSGRVINDKVTTATISAKDASEDTIIGGWFDATGNAVTFKVTSNAPSVELSPAPATVTSAAPTAKVSYFSSLATPAQILNGFTATITATPSNTGTSPGTAALTLAKPAFTEFNTETSGSSPQGITVGPDGALWFTENAIDKIGRVTTSGSVSEFSTGITGSAQPESIATGQDGNLWFTENGLGKVASISTSGTVVEYLTPSGANDLPTGIVAGPDGNMWFTETANSASNIGKFSPTALDNSVGIIKEFTTATANSGPAQIAVGPDNKLWFTESLVDKIGNITTSGTGATDYALVSNSIGEGGITAGSDGAMWFAECNPNSGHAIGRITSSGSITLPGSFTNTFTSPLGIVTGPDGAEWFTENCTGNIGRISPTDPTHTIVEFPIPTVPSYPVGIVKGPDGAIWFVESLTNKVGKLQ
jgi:virginiamycin B lyase